MICFQTQNVIQNQIRLFYAIVNVHYVNVKPLSFEVLALLTQLNNNNLFLDVNRKPSTHSIEGKIIAK